MRSAGAALLDEEADEEELQRIVPRERAIRALIACWAGALPRPAPTEDVRIAIRSRVHWFPRRSPGHGRRRRIRSRPRSVQSSGALGPDVRAPGLADSDPTLRCDERRRSRRSAYGASLVSLPKPCEGTTVPDHVIPRHCAAADATRHERLMKIRRTDCEPRHRSRPMMPAACPSRTDHLRPGPDPSCASPLLMRCRSSAHHHTPSGYNG
jgi:hypothetical protein